MATHARLTLTSLSNIQLLEEWGNLETGYRIPKRLTVVGCFSSFVDARVDHGPRMPTPNQSERLHLLQPRKSGRTSEPRFSKLRNQPSTGFLLPRPLPVTEGGQRCPDLTGGSHPHPLSHRRKSPSMRSLLRHEPQQWPPPFRRLKKKRGN